MADRRRNTSGCAQTNDQNSDEERDLDVEPSNGTPSRDRSQHTSGRSDTTPVPHSSVQSHTAMEVDIRNSNTVQQQTNSSSRSDSQLATGPTFNVVDNKGPTQVGEGSTVVYNITNNHYHCPLHPSHHHGDSSTYHAPDHCPECLHYHHSDHPPFCQHDSNHQESESRHLSLPRHPVPQLLPSPQQTEHMVSTVSRGNGMQRTQPQSIQSANQIIGQRSTPSQQSSPSDVKTYVHRSAREETSDARAANSKAGARKKEGKSKTTCKVSESARMKPVSGDDVADTLSIIDTEGQKLLPGDAVWFEGDFDIQYGIYIGRQMTVTCERGSLMVKKMKLNLTDPFEKMTVFSEGEYQVYPPRERVDRATAWIGRKFEEGNEWDGFDFPVWIFTGLGFIEAEEKGFMLVFETGSRQEGE